MTMAGSWTQSAEASSRRRHRRARWRSTSGRDQYGWVVDHETVAERRARGLWATTDRAGGSAGVRGLRSLRGGPERQQHGGGLGPFLTLLAGHDAFPPTDGGTDDDRGRRLSRRTRFATMSYPLPARAGPVGRQQAGGGAAAAQPHCERGRGPDATVNGIPLIGPTSSPPLPRAPPPPRSVGKSRRSGRCRRPDSGSAHPAPPS